MSSQKNKKTRRKAAAVPPVPVAESPVKVKVYRPTPNRHLMQVQIPTGEAGTMRVELMRVKDSRFYRPGEMIPAMPGERDIWQPLKQRFAPAIGNL
jgi:hypothetical protein